MPCISSHTRTQSPQRMHLLMSTVIALLLRSTGGSSRVSGKRMSWMPKRIAISCKRQERFFSQVVQSRQWAARISSMMVRR